MMDKSKEIIKIVIGNLELSMDILIENAHYKAAESIEKAIYHLNNDKIAKELEESTKIEALKDYSESMKMSVVKDFEESGESEVEI
jgi:hypothetical protein